MGAVKIADDDATPDTRTRILMAGEKVFADQGTGATMRAIAAEAGVAQGLLHYHFDTKQRLYAAIVGWRAQIINSERLLMLDEVPADAGLEAILEALFRPALGHDAGGEAFGRIMASLMTSDAEHQALVREHYDPTAAIFIEAIARAVGLPHVDAAWGYSLAIHALVAGMTRTGRTERLAETGSANEDVTLANLVEFAAGGIERLAQK